MFSIKSKEKKGKNETENGMKRNKYAVYEKSKKRKLPTSVKVCITLGVVGVLLAGTYFAVQHLLNKGALQNEIVTSVSSRGQLSAIITGWGVSKPKQKVNVGETAIGTITSIFVKSGDSVKQGDVLFELDPKQAKKDLETATSEYNRKKEDLKQTQEDIENLTTCAPFDGLLIECSEFSEGESISAGTQIGRIVDDSKMKLELWFSYGYSEQITEGMPASVSVPKTMTNLAGSVLSVEKIRKVNDDGTVCFKATIVVDNPGTLKEGMEATAIIYGDENIYPYGDGILGYLNEEKIYAKTAGEVKQSYTHQYYDYKKGDKLLSLTNSSLYTSLSEVRAKCQELYENIEKYQKAISESSIVSPIDGVVTSIVIDVGDEVSGSSAGLMTISDTSEMLVEGQIDEIDISNVTVGMPVDISFSKTDGMVNLVGKVTSLSYEASSTSGGDVAFFPFTISIDNPDGLMPGMGVNYSITAILKEDCITVPASSVIYTEQGPSVFVKAENADMYPDRIELSEENVPEGFIAVPVEIGISDEYNTEIKSGIDEGVEVYCQQSVMQDYSSSILW